MTIHYEHQSEEMRRTLMAEICRSFDLSRGPLIRVSLILLGEHIHVLVLTAHHIIADGWSLGVFMRELIDLYEAYHEGRQASLPGLPLRYVDYAIEERRKFESGGFETQLSYWKQQLSGCDPQVKLPFARHGRSDRRWTANRIPVRFPPYVTEGARALCGIEGVTVFMVALAGFAALLHCYSEQPEILVGTDAANRNRRELEGLIGFFVNLIPVRIDLSGNPSFRVLLQRVKRVAIEAYAHQDLPFDRLVHALKLERSLDRAPLFNVKFILQNTAPAAIKTRDLSITSLVIPLGAVTDDLVLAIVDGAGDLEGWIEYSTDLFMADHMHRMARNYEAIMGEVVLAPATNIEQLKQRLFEQNQWRMKIEQEMVKRAATLRLSVTKRRPGILLRTPNRLNE